LKAAGLTAASTGARADGRERFGSREVREVREETRRTATTFFLLLFFAPFAIVALFA
jgi:hypothetical protein